MDPSISFPRTEIYQPNDDRYPYDNDKCGICWEQYKNQDKIIQLACKHIWHDKCLLSSYRKCPRCREEIIGRMKIYDQDEIETVINSLIQKILQIVPNLTDDQKINEIKTKGIQELLNKQQLSQGIFDDVAAIEMFTAHLNDIIGENNDDLINVARQHVICLQEFLSNLEIKEEYAPTFLLPLGELRFREFVFFKASMMMEVLLKEPIKNRIQLYIGCILNLLDNPRMLVILEEKKQASITLYEKKIAEMHPSERNGYLTQTLSPELLEILEKSSKDPLITLEINKIFKQKRQKKYMYGIYYAVLILFFSYFLYRSSEKSER